MPEKVENHFTTTHNQEVPFKRLKRNLNCLTCNENQTNGQVRLTQINIWVYS